jgi:acetate---CoA ligase (ADP-forming)
VMLKAVAPDLAHRSDAGLVSAKISSAAELETAFAALQKKTREIPGVDGSVTVERFVPHDLEMILGVKYDPTFGPVVLCGAGGIFTEVLKDYALRLSPLAPVDAEDLLASLKAFPALQKVTAGSNAWTSLVDALLRLSDLAVNLEGKISAVDINPIGLSAGSSDITVLDAKIHV